MMSATASSAVVSRDAKFRLAGVIRHLIASECQCDVSYRYRLVVRAVGQTNRCSSSVTALIICQQVAGDPPRNGRLPPPWRGMDSRLY